MLKLFNSLGKKIQTFYPVNKNDVTIFTCGPSVYQKAHIGNFRTFLFEDILVRYLEYSGYRVRRCMNFTDIEDKAIAEAGIKRTSVRKLTDKNISAFIDEMKLLRAKIPDHLPRASESVEQAVDIIELLLKRNIAYWHKGSVYFNPLKYSGFGKLYGLDMSLWPKEKKRFHKDTYSGMRWNSGDFILWHGYKKEDKNYWGTRIGKGRPSWNIQDPSMIRRYFNETLSIACGGIDNLFRHHDYTLSILESVNPFPAARFWLHCNHVYVNGSKMSKSKGNIYYAEMLLKKGYSIREIRFFLIYNHYRERINFTAGNMSGAAAKLRVFLQVAGKLKKIAGGASGTESKISRGIRKIFSDSMDNDLNVKNAFNAMADNLSGIRISDLSSSKAAGILNTLKEIDKVLKVIF